ncbi:hypothetical protein JCGZ_22487 [Jatropha curcas]|uniref:Ubiquitin-like domain-containing protein n=1 Tax=Jatropha curcas TaxID=180498 RepID=A0A067JQN1_JATCU|nr:polyubiquitin [Jatropha curcas]KDP26241.1 hypothetical protein JCGZ_22487 [Jatropha curcas]
MANKVSVKIENKDMKLDLSFSPSDSILQVKQRVEDLLEWKAETLSLFYNGEELKNDHSLESYNLKEGGRAHFDLVRPSEPPEPKFYVRVKSHHKEGFLGMRPSYPVSYLKNKIERKWGYDGSNIDLTHDNVLMGDDFTVSYYNISERSVIKLDVKEEDIAIPYPSQHGR